MNRAARLLTIGLSPVLLIGCGGGGGGDTAPAVVVDPVTLTSQNAPIVAAAVVQTTLEGGTLGSFAGLGGGTGGVLRARDSQLFAKLGEIQKSQTESLRSKAQIGALQDTIPPETTACLNAGTVTVSGQVSNPLTLSPSDTFMLLFSACDDGAGVVSGTYAMRITSFSGDLLSGSFSFGVMVTLSGFQITDAGETVTANGTVAVSLNTTATPTLSISVTSTALTVSDGTSTHTLSDFSLMQFVDELTSAYTMTVSGALTSSAFAGRVTFSTVAALQSDGAGYAFGGELTIMGAGNASIDVIVLDSVLIRLEIDLNGDGTPDELVDTTWDDLVVQT
jgi:hypothetical protein